jgi:hypothetical protein
VVLDADREQILAFRLSSQPDPAAERSFVGAKRLRRAGSRRRPWFGGRGLPGRVEKLTPCPSSGRRRSRTLVILWSVRGAPYVVPSPDLAVFSVGGPLPRDRTSFKQSLGGWADALEEPCLDPFETLDRMVSVARAPLDGRTLNVKELRPEASECRDSTRCRLTLWRSRDPARAIRYASRHDDRAALQNLY